MTKWILRKVNARWFCRNCHQKGIAEISMNIKTNTVPTIPEVLQMIQTTCHTDCKQPDIRLHYDSRKQIN